jgi:predicted metal-binding membrane protein
MSMRTSDAVLEYLLRRDRWILLGGLAAVMLLAWIWLVSGAGMEMSAVEMTRMAGMDGWLMQPAEWTPGYAALMVSMWWVMMVAMMLPSATPVLLLYLGIARKKAAGGAPVVPAAVFAAGYLLAWGAFSLAAASLQWGLESLRLLSPMLATGNSWLGAGILVAAGLWQLTPLKTACLRHCRSPLAFLMHHWRDGRGGALRMGLEHGGYCLGCCWFLMALLFVGGVMNLYWIAGLAAFVLLEKTVPHGHWLGRAAGVALIGWGVALPLL